MARRRVSRMRPTPRTARMTAAAVTRYRRGILICPASYRRTDAHLILTTSDYSRIWARFGLRSWPPTIAGLATTTRIGIIGLGRVGASAAISLLHSGVAE